MWVFGVRLPADSDTPGGGDATIASEGLAGWTEDFDRACHGPHERPCVAGDACRL
jgi:hypothetical protein